MIKEKNKALLSLVSSMTIFGTIGIFRKFIPLPSGFLAMSRGFIGTFFLVLLMFFGRKRIDLAAIGKKIWLLIISGALIGLNWILLFEAYNYTSVATATLCYYAAPIFVMIASPFLLGERLTAKKTVCILIAALGMTMVSGVFSVSFGGIRDLIGVFLGLGAALIYASVVILNKKIGNIPPYEKTATQLLSAAIVILPYVFLAEDISAESFNLTSLIMVLVVGILHTGVAYALYFGSMSSLGAQTVALFSYIDPIVAIILSAVVLQENIGLLGYVGAFLVLGSTLLSELPEKNKTIRKEKMNEKINVRGINFDDLTLGEAASLLWDHMENGEGLKAVYTPNAEIVQLCIEKNEYYELINSAEMIVPDGIGVVKAAKILGTPMKERVPGIELGEKMLELCANTGHKVYFLGGNPGVAELAAENMTKKYEGLCIAGTADGYFKKDGEESDRVIEDIVSSGAELLFVCLGVPVQEKWIFDNKARLGVNVKVCMALGGSLDVYSGGIKRAPAIFRKTGFEWLYRLLKQPSRIGRMMKLPKFLLGTYAEKLRKKS